MSSAIKSMLIFFGCCSFVGSANAQLDNYFNEAKKSLGDVTNKKKGSSLSTTDITAGLKDALKIGAQNATTKVSALDGFFGNAAIKILMPPEAKKVENTLREIGLGDQVDKAILSMNRGAEDASKKAFPIIWDAIKSMTIEDGLSILNGNKDAATQYLKTKTSVALKQAFLPEIKASLDKVGATKYWAEVFRLYDEIPFVQKVNTDLPAYVTDKALSGVFVLVAEEEAKIRTNPVAQVTDILKKVFGKR